MEALQVVDDGLDADLVDELDRDHVARLLERGAKPDRTLVVARVVARRPHLVVVHVLDRRVLQDAGGGEAVVERGRVHERLEGASRAGAGPAARG